MKTYRIRVDGILFLDEEGFECATEYIGGGSKRSVDTMSFEEAMRLIHGNCVSTWEEGQMSWRWIDGEFTFGVYNGIESDSWFAIACIYESK